jgi:hypothetical protein
MKTPISRFYQRILGILLVLLLLSVPLLATEGVLRQLLPSLSDTQIKELLAGEILDGSTIGGGSISQYFVKGTEAAQSASLAERATDGFSIAAVSYIPYTPTLANLDHHTRQLTIFNTIRAISTQEGIEYISWRAGNKPKLLIERSAYMEDDKNLNKLLPDPVAVALPRSIQSYVYQRDTSFGGNRYLHTYTNDDDEIFVAIKNISSMKVFGIFTAVPKEQLTISMGTYQSDDGLLLTALATISNRKPQVSVLGITVDLPSAFMRRIRALQGWLVDQLNMIE